MILVYFQIIIFLIFLIILILSFIFLQERVKNKIEKSEYILTTQIDRMEKLLIDVYTGKNTGDQISANLDHYIENSILTVLSKIDFNQIIEPLTNGIIYEINNINSQIHSNIMTMKEEQTTTISQLSDISELTTQTINSLDEIKTYFNDSLTSIQNSNQELNKYIGTFDNIKSSIDRINPNNNELDSLLDKICKLADNQEIIAKESSDNLSHVLNKLENMINNIESIEFGNKDVPSQLIKIYDKQDHIIEIINTLRKYLIE